MSKRMHARVVVCDIVKVEDLDTRLDQLLRLNKLKLIAGCAALAESLVRKIDLQRVEKKAFSRTKRMYIACGSLNKITAAQVEYATQRGEFERRHLSMEQKLDAHYYNTVKGKAFLEEMITLCKENRKVVVDSFDMGEEKDRFLKQHQIPAENVRTLIPAAHGRIIQALMNSGLDITVLMTGGDTLMGYMNLIGCTQLEPICEIEPGAVLSFVEQNGIRHQVISKSGGFGDRDILCKISEKIIK